MYNKFIDEYLHNSCTILTFATAFRPAFLKVPREMWLAEISKAPLKRRAEYKRSVIEHGLDSEFVVDALAHHRKLLSWMSDSLERARSLPASASQTPIAQSFPIFCGWNCSSSPACGKNNRASPTGGHGCARDLRSRPPSSTACRKTTGLRSGISRPTPGQGADHVAGGVRLRQAIRSVCGSAIPPSRPSCG